MTDSSRSVEIVLKGEKVNLLLEKAIYFPERKILVLADLHFGKASHFRKHGIYVPPFQELEILNGLCEEVKPEHLIFLGDLFHSVANESVTLFTEWSISQSFRMTLIQGNHDILPCDLYQSMKLECISEFNVGELLLLHDRDERREEFTIYGHVHPAITILGKGRQGINLPAFVLDPNSLLLPAFGKFTGNFVVSRNGNNIFYALTTHKIFMIR